ncbi:MAG: heme ABC exporter ATP-binding protein CcmA [Actinomycetota bacterium]|nr:heme ABC exporter ATP-binding protein CcmA [Actinomycetota bacterium]
MAPAVHLRDALALAGRFPALAGVDVDVEAGEVVVVRGANGAGKTSLLRLCAGLLALTSGEGRVVGHDLRTRRREVRRHVGLLGHSNHLYDDLTVEENIRFGVASGGGRLDGVAAAMDHFGLRGRLAGVPAGRCSTGQRRRCALAVLLARSPMLWLLDEPHSGLDPEGRHLLGEMIRRGSQGGATVLVATHEGDPFASVDVAASGPNPREIVMGGGLVVSDRPASMAAAGS